MSTALSKWADILQNVHYKQGYGSLKHRDEAEVGYSYCCLGILCEAVLELPQDENYNYSVGFKMPGADGYTLNVLTPELAEMYGLTKEVTQDELDDIRAVLPGRVVSETISSTRQRFLANLNDRGVPFFAIGMVIKMLGWDDA